MEVPVSVSIDGKKCDYLNSMLFWTCRTWKRAFWKWQYWVKDCHHSFSSVWVSHSIYSVTVWGIWSVQNNSPRDRKLLLLHIRPPQQAPVVSDLGSQIDIFLNKDTASRHGEDWQGGVGPTAQINRLRGGGSDHGYPHVEGDHVRTLVLTLWQARSCGMASGWTARCRARDRCSVR